MSTYPVDVKAVQKSTAATHTIFAGPGRIVGLYINKEPSLHKALLLYKMTGTAVAALQLELLIIVMEQVLTEYIHISWYRY